MKKLVLCLLASLVAVIGVGSFTLAQTSQSEPRIVSGDDIGFRVEGTEPRTGRPTGTLMLRMDGEWVEAGWSGGVRLIK
jgi:hypothetical protein